MNNWQTLENNVKSLSQIIWSTNPISETINGVKCDCILKIKSDHWICIEISKTSTLEKLRTDLAKFATIRLFLFSQNIYSECIFVTNENHPSLRESGKGSNIEVLSEQELFSKFLGSNEYIYKRKNAPFGSAIDIETGESDNTEYVAMQYFDNDGSKYNIPEICNLILSGKKIILLGEFGSGKSRCLMEVFKELTKSKSNFTPIAINLRDNWGYKKYSHLIQNHLDDLGLTKYKDNLVTSLKTGKHPILIDGLDEIGSQSWSGDINRLHEIRKSSLQGLRDLITNCHKAGMLLTGREHYFNNNHEMLECLDLKQSEVLIIKCPNEFSKTELHKFIKQRTNIETFPSWLPKKPLLCQLITRLEPSDLKKLLSTETGEIDFFEMMLDAVCYRETKTHTSIYKDALKQIQLELATLSREKKENTPSLSQSDISKIFEKVTGSAPIDESAIVLQRLPYLGRSGSETGNRVFIDDYALDGLRALSLCEKYYNKNNDIKNKAWHHPLQSFGYRIVGKKIEVHKESVNYFKELENHGNKTACADFVGSMISTKEKADFFNLHIENADFGEIDLSGCSISNLKISGSIFSQIHIDNHQLDNVTFSNCSFSTALGIAGPSGFPSEFINCASDNYENILNSARISELNLSNGKKTLIAILKKLYFQPGRGRKEGALLRGSEGYWDKNSADTIIQYMMKNDFIDKFKGDDGFVYVPNRSLSPRIRNIMHKLNNSEDELWKLIE